MQLLGTAGVVFVGVLYRARTIEDKSWDYAVSSGAWAALAWVAIGLALALGIDRYRRSIRYPPD